VTTNHAAGQQPAQGEKMTPITNLVQQHGSQAALARHFKVAPNQVHRWVQIGAMVDKHGNVWIITKKAQ